MLTSTIYTLSAQLGMQWTAPVDVSLTTGNASPKVGVLLDGSPALIWGNGATILFAKMINGTFITPIPLSTGSNSPDIYSFGGIDMAIKNDQIFIVYENFNNGVFTIRSTDGGENFELPVNVYDPIPGKWATLPSIAIDDNGNPLVSVILENTNETDGQYVMFRSNDAGITYGPPTVASAPADGDYVCECCPSDIYTEGEEVFLVFRNNDNNLRDMWVSKSEDNGDSFNQAVDVDATDWILNSCPISGPKIAQLTTDSLITIWKSGGNGAVRVYISTFNSDTMEKGFEKVLPLSNINATQGSSDIAGTKDTIGIVWAESGFGVNGKDLKFALSINGSENLFSNFDNITEAPLSQDFPSLAYSNEVFHLLYTNGVGLQYKRGVISDLVSLNDPVQNSLCLELMENPSTDGSIKIKSTCSIDGLSIHAQLIDLSGKTIINWERKMLSWNNEIIFNFPEIPKGLYLFSITSKKGLWSEKILIHP